MTIKDLYSTALAYFGVLTINRENEILNSIVDKGGIDDSFFLHKNERNTFLWNNNLIDGWIQSKRDNIHPDVLHEINMEITSDSAKILTQKNEQLMRNMWESDKKIFPLQTDSTATELLIVKYGSIPSITEEQVKIFREIGQEHLSVFGIPEFFFKTQYAKDNNITWNLDNVDKVTPLHLLIAEEKISITEEKLINLQKEYQNITGDIKLEFEQSGIIHDDEFNRSMEENAEHLLSAKIEKIKEELENHEVVYQELKETYNYQLQLNNLPKDWANLDSIKFKDALFSDINIANELIEKYSVYPVITEEQIKVIYRHVIDTELRNRAHNMNLHNPLEKTVNTLLNTDYAKINNIAKDLTKADLNKPLELYSLVLRNNVQEVQKELKACFQLYDLDNHPDHGPLSMNADQWKVVDNDIEKYTRLRDINKSMYKEVDQFFKHPLPETWRKDLIKFENIKDLDNNQISELILKYNDYPLITEKQIQIINRNFTPESLANTELVDFVLLKTEYAKINNATWSMSRMPDQVNELHILTVKCNLARLENALNQQIISHNSLEGKIEDIINAETKAGLKPDLQRRLNITENMYNISYAQTASLELEIEKYNQILSNYEMAYSSPSISPAENNHSNSLSTSKEIASSGSKSLIADISNDKLDNYRIVDLTTKTTKPLILENMDISKQPIDSLKKILSGGKAELVDSTGTTNLYSLTNSPTGYALTIGKQLLGSMDAGAEA